MEFIDRNECIVDVPLPDILKGKLEFGNRDQIQALKDYEKEIDEAIEKHGQINSGHLKKFIVTVVWEGMTEIEVYAESKAKAESLAKEECFDFDPDFVDYRARLGGKDGI